MATVLIEYRNGRRKKMNLKVANTLARKGIVKIVEDSGVEQAEVEFNPQLQPELPANEQNQQADDLDNMDRDALLKMADDLEIKIDRRMGDEKIREFIREQTS